jgi:hypothetical protein
MPHLSGPDWYARELAELQEEIARLYRLLEVITPIGEPHEEPPAHPVHTRPTPASPRPRLPTIPLRRGAPVRNARTGRGRVTP